MYIAVLTLPDIPRYNPDDIIDELFIELKSRASGEESQVENVMGERQKVVLSVSLSVECVSEYLGDDCNSHCTDPKCDPGNAHPYEILQTFSISISYNSNSCITSFTILPYKNNHSYSAPFTIQWELTYNSRQTD